MEFLRSVLRRRFAGKPVLAFQNVGSCFLRLPSKMKASPFQGSHAPWKSFNFQIKLKALKVLENCRRCWEVLEFQCYLYYSLIRTPKENKQTQKDLRDKSAHGVEELKKTDSRVFFPWMESLKNGKCVLDSPWKVLEFFVQKRVRTLPFLTFFISQVKWQAEVHHQASSRTLRWRMCQRNSPNQEQVFSWKCTRRRSTLK